jgi:Trk-type K+ transport system membrane component
MTAATLLILLVSRRLGVRTRLIAERESKALSFGNVRQVVVRIALLFLSFQAVLAAVLTVRFVTGYDYGWGKALWYGVFHSISAFNNAGFALYSDSLEGFVTDFWICLPIAVAVIIGGLGFPVLAELHREWRRVSAWSITTRLTLGASGALLVLATVFFLISEWTNPDTFGPLSVPAKLLAGFFTGVMPRSAGLNVVNIAELGVDSWLVTDALMFVGAGSAGTSGGIKVTTFAVLAFVMYAEIRGEPDVAVGARRVPYEVQRQAMTVALAAVGLVATGTLIVSTTTTFDLDRVLFETVSAFGTTGLSTGITPDLPDVGKWTLIALMFLGRVGTITAAAALALNSRRRLYRLPEERVIVG